jgi:hypothetical protein
MTHFGTTRLLTVNVACAALFAGTGSVAAEG